MSFNRTRTLGVFMNKPSSITINELCRSGAALLSFYYPSQVYEAQQGEML